MNPDFARLYETELRFLKAEAAEFARREWKIAARLGLSQKPEEEVRDPFVERLLEGSAYLAARVTHKLEAEFPQLIEGILGTVFPQFLNPVPSTGIVAFEPDADTPPAGHVIGRETRLRSHAAASVAGKGRDTVCTFTTAHPVRLLPLRVTHLEYNTRSVESLGLPPEWSRARSCLRIVLCPTGRAKLSDVAYDELDFFLSPSCPERGRLYEMLLGRVIGVQARVGEVIRRLPGQAVSPVGFDSDVSLLPRVANRFEGYRLLREYFAIPDRFLFVRLAGLKAPVVPASAKELEILIPFDRDIPRLQALKPGRVRKVGEAWEPGDLQLFCTPVINLFSKSDLPSVVLEDRFSEYGVRADEDRDDDFELFDLTEVVAKDGDLQDVGLVSPLFGVGLGASNGQGPFYSLHRVAQRAGKSGAIAPDYAGSRVYLRLLDGHCKPFNPRDGSLRMLLLEGRCTNRDLPLSLALGVRESDFESPGAFVEATRFVVAPKPPVEALTSGPLVWRLISHLSLNYFSLVGDGEADGDPRALRELLRLYFPSSGEEGDGNVDPRLSAILNGLRKVRHEPTTRLLPAETFGQEMPMMVRGLEITLTVEESAFVGTGAFLFGALLDHFFQGYVALNSFVETVLCSTTGQEIHRWRPRIGTKPRL